MRRAKEEGEHRGGTAGPVQPPRRRGGSERERSGEHYRLRARRDEYDVRERKGNEPSESLGAGWILVLHERVPRRERHCPHREEKRDLHPTEQRPVEGADG